MKMKKNIILAAAIAAALCSCATTETAGTNDAAAKKFESWIAKYHPEARKTELGAYIISDKPGTGDAVGTYEDNLYVRLEYVSQTLAGTLKGYSSPDLAKQMDAYDPTACYAPLTICRTTSSNLAGLDESFCEMKVGGERTLAIPGWLTTYLLYDTADEYYKNSTGTDLIYDFKIVEAFNDLDKWEADSIERYISHAGIGSSSVQNDTTGFYYIRTGEPESEEDFSDSDTFTINYTGMRLDGQIFDTTIRDVAVDAGIYSSSKTYEPQKVTYATEYSDIQLASSSVIDGFAMALAKMHPGEKATVIMSSTLGYGTSGSGSLINKYCPLRFDIEMVEYTVAEDSEE